MRKITKESINAFLNQQKFYKDNTKVNVLPNVTILKLFGKDINFPFWKSMMNVIVEKPND